MHARPATVSCPVFPGARILRQLPYQPDREPQLDVLATRDGTLALDSGGGIKGDRYGRYDYLFAAPIASRAWPDGRPEDFLAALRPAAWPDTAISCGGVLGYAFGHALMGLRPRQDAPEPETWAGWYDWAIVTDHVLHRRWLSASTRASDERCAEILELTAAAPVPPPPPFQMLSSFQPDADRHWYQQAFAQIQRHIQAGDCYQVNLTRRFSCRWQGDLLQAWQRIRQRCPVAMGAWLRAGDTTLLCHSPERFLRVRGRQVRTEPIKGTRRRDNDRQRDRALAAELLGSGKDRAENVMIVDLLRNDLGRSCAYGSIRVPALCSLQSNPSVHHLVSTVCGELAGDRDVVDLLRGTLPGGSITGAPKRKAMEIIAELEPHAREAYCGSVFRLDRDGNLDSNIVIRSLLARGDRLYAWGGGGIVADSDCDAEYEEAWVKLARMLNALQEAAA